MKKLLLLLFIFIAFSGYSQTPIQNFDSAEGSKYFVVTSSPVLDQNATGNTTWNFNGLSTTGVTTEDAYTSPVSAADEAEYPNTTSLQTTTPSSDDPIKIYSENITNSVSYTGIVRNGLILNYDGDNTRNLLPANPPPNNNNGNAFVGVFPLAFGVTSTDDVSGSFVATVNGSTINGLFEGSITTSVDAYGTLNTNDLGNGAYSGQVTRLKIEQNLVFNQLNGVATQISYYYYDSITGNLIFRYNSVEITASFVGTIEETLIEHLDTSTLSTDRNILTANAFNIYPNPVSNNLNFNLSEGITIESISVYDITGRQVVNEKVNTNSFDASSLKSGIYILTAETNKGSVSRKFVKK